MQRIFDELAESFDPSTLTDSFLLWLPNIVVATVTLLGFWLVWRLVRSPVQALTKRTGIDPTAAAFIETVIRYVLLAVALVTALGQLGVDTASILASLGVVGLTVGFAARDTLSNVISGLFIFWDRPFVIGDLVEIGETYGRVETITMRSTRLVTPDGRMLAIPNSVVVNTTVASYTNFPHLRLDLDVTVGVGEDLGRVRQTLLGLVGDDPRFMTEPAPQVVVTALNDYNVAMQLRVWLNDEKSHISARMELREAMFEALRAVGVDMPYETLEVRSRAAAP